MNNFLTYLILLIIPFLTKNLPEKRSSTVRGLLLSLVFLCEINPLLYVIPLSSAFALYFSYPSSEKKSLTIRKELPVFLPLLMISLALMSIFIGVSHVPFEASFFYTEGYRNFALIFSPICFGAYMDSFGFLKPWIIMCLLGEAAILFLSLGENKEAFSILGEYLFAFCHGGFFLLFPDGAKLLLGRKSFSKFYIYLAFWVTSILWFSNLVAETYVNTFIFNNSLKFILAVLPISVALFIYLTWLKRYNLVVE